MGNLEQGYIYRYSGYGSNYMPNPGDLAVLKCYTTPRVQKHAHDSGEAIIGSSAISYKVSGLPKQEDVCEQIVIKTYSIHNS
jgi:hypothetical protein